jgi:alpha-galactosidase
MVRNTINRMPMHGRWWINDPDCMLLRETTSFTPAEILGESASQPASQSG